MNLAIVVPTFSPAPYDRPRMNLIRFREAIGVPFIHMLAPYYQAPIFPESRAIETSERNLLWLKECLVNIAIRDLPPEYDAVAWIDGDLLFQNPDWYEQTCRELEQHSVVQMFEMIAYLGPNDEFRSGGYGTAAAEGRVGWRAPGGAIACRRELLEHGIYDRHVLGGGDEIFMEACMGRAARFYDKLNPAFRDHVREWCEAFGQHEVGFVPGAVHHLWHGDRAGRKYVERHQVLASHDFNPMTDVRIRDGLLEWASDKPELHAAVRNYFTGRAEDQVTSSVS